MAEPLAVDPARLIAAASQLSELVLPAPPAPMAVPGSDSMSAAINQTMPSIEALVGDGLPGVTASLKRTASSMSTAADIYTRADQSLGQALSQYGFGAAGQTLSDTVMGAMTGQSSGLVGAGSGAAAASLAAPAAAAQQVIGVAGGAVSQVGAAVGAQAQALSPQVAATIPQLVQLAPMAQQMAPMGQQVGQSIQQSASQAGQGGSSAQLTSDNTPADDENKEDEDDSKEDAAKDGVDAQSADGAAPGSATLVSAPVQSTGGGTSPVGSVAAPI